MMSSNRSNAYWLTLAMAIACISLWQLVPVKYVSPSTWTMLAILLCATTFVLVNTWMNGQATRSMGQLLHATETDNAAKGRQSATASPSSHVL